MSDILYKRIIVKVGTSTLTYDTGSLNLRRMEKLSCVLSDIKNRGAEVVLVSSGAVSAGVAKTGYKGRPATLIEKQALASVGQAELMKMYDRFFTGFGHKVAQILLTKYVMDDDEMRENVYATFKTLLDMDIIPIVNENDSVSYHGLKFGGNDILSAYVALLCDADILINLTDIDGLYDKNPRENDDAVLLKRVRRIDDNILAMAGGAGTNRGTGGMRAKLESAAMVTEKGIAMVIASGSDPEVIYDIVEGRGVGTYFCPAENV